MTDEAADELIGALARWRSAGGHGIVPPLRRPPDRPARSQLSPRLANRVDPEDVVQSVYRSFFAESRAGKYQLEHGGDLWQLLVTITLHKLANQANRLAAQKHSVSRERHFSSEDSLLGIGAPVLARQPSPAEAVALADQLESTLRMLEPPQRRIVEMRLQGYILEEIAAALPCSLSTVRRVLRRFKEQVEQDGGESERS